MTKLEQFLSNLLAKYPSLQDKLIAITKVGEGIVGLGDDILDAPATAEAVATFATAFGTLGQKAQLAEAETAFGKGTPGYNAVLQQTNHFTDMFAEAIRSAVPTAVELAGQHNMNEGAVLFGLLKRDLDMVQRANAANPQTVWDIILAAPEFFFS